MGLLLVRRGSIVTKSNPMYPIRTYWGHPTSDPPASSPHTRMLLNRQGRDNNPTPLNIKRITSRLLLNGYEECVETYTSLRETFNNPSSSQARYNSDIPAKNPRIPSHRGHLATHQGSLIKQSHGRTPPARTINLPLFIQH